MRKLEIADPDIMRIAIQQEIARSDESRYGHRLHGLLLLTGGQSCQQVADLFGKDRRTVQRWVKRFEEHGLEGMHDGERLGRPACLDAKQWASLERDLRRSASDFGHVGHHHARLLAPLLQNYRKVLTLLFLPPYSPQLAPIERVWKLTRRLATHNRYFETLGEVLEVVQQCFARWQKPNLVLKRPCGIS